MNVFLMSLSWRTEDTFSESSVMLKYATHKQIRPRNSQNQFLELHEQLENIHKSQIGL